ncbi:hypothetical protein U8527_20785 [Kordia algicida OT-1]|uniref:Uncharacterized protein n=1 Tax=Kordia algicida OT-1 TaxID=391587 RepID=A9DKZ5_9FLAO|nr:hypothetical protein [Kordia algicida]EDP98439.1 hypothetical protein KAOT1_14517 [Kordia algicida OT-1]
MKKLLFLIAILSMSVGMAQKKQAKERAGKNAEDKEFPTQYAFPKEYVGTYAGNLNIADASGVLQNVPMELRITPTEDPKKFEYVMSYIVAKKKDERKYTLIVVDPAKGLYDLDENNGVVLRANYMRQTLFSTFEVNNRILNSSVEFKNDGRIFFNIIVTEKADPRKTGGEKLAVTSYHAVVIQKAALRKVERD